MKFHPPSPLRTKNRRLGGIVIGCVLFMVILSFASVPLYKLFCQKTGYGGTPQVALEGCGRVTDRVITVRFNADVNRDLPWDFRPLQTEITVRAGETGLAFYQVRNRASSPLPGIAI